MRLSATTLLLAGTLGLANASSTLHAQTSSTEMPTQYGQLLPDGPRATILPALQSIKAAPISASFQIERKQVLANGSTITDTRTGKIARDSEGRTYFEMTTLRDAAANPPTYTSININDPVSGIQIVLIPNSHIARRYTRTPRTADVAQLRPVTPGTGMASAGSPGQPTRPLLTPPSTPAIEKEDLGVDSMEGIPVRHYRETRTIPAGQIGNDQELVITSELWYSKELRMNLKSTHNDPRFGEERLMLSALDRGEPPASLFEIPADYTVTDVERGAGVITSTSGAAAAQKP
jgi:hypothetical protein